MSQITRCPACGTLFKVVPDQLRISEGWVRCGHCADVFNATAQLQEAADSDLQGGAPGRKSIEPIAQAAAAPSSEAGPEPVVFFESSLNTEIDEAVAFDALDSAQLDAEAQALKEHPLDRPFELRRRDDHEIESTYPSKAESGFDSEAESDEEDASPSAMDDVSFVRNARRKSLWARPRVRAALLLGALALGILLTLQIAVHDRDRLAAARPALHPWLAGLCQMLNCRIGPPRQIDAIAIESSSFSKLRGDAYRLNVTLKNQSGTTVAMPALELTLTDGQDQAVVRRVLMPAELGPGASVIAATSEWSGSLALALAANDSSARVAGYRLLAFYP